MSRCPSCSAPADESNRFCPSCGAAVALPSSLTASLPTPASPPHPTDRPQAVAGRPVAGQGRFLPGALLAGRYRVVGLLGRGGMGEVYRADDTKLGQTVALKFLPEALARDATRLERFFAEVSIGRQVSHPNVCRLYDLVEMGGHHCLSMEYVDGEDLASLLKRIGRLPADKAIDVARDLCAGLAAAHDKGVIHRDLKPANVMIDGKGRARITDFGLAVLAEDVGGEALAGTPAYMAPEQLAGKAASIRTDIYALGLVLYETFTGKRLFDAKSIAQLKALHAETKPPSLSSSVRDVPVAVERMILRCLEEDPASRPDSVHALMAALPGGDPLQAALAAGETPSPAMVAAAGKVGELRAGVAWACLVPALAGMVLIAFLAGTTTLIGTLRPEKPPEALADRAREIVAKLEYVEPPADTWQGFDSDDDALAYLGERDRSPGRWRKLPAVRPGPLLFVYRQSPRKLVARRTIMRPFSPAEVGRLLSDDPPLDVPGMIDVVLDRRGWLTGFRAVPLQLDASPSGREPDWGVLLAASGLDPSGLTPVATRWAAPVDTDRKAAWDGAYAGQPQIPIHVEAAAYHGRPVWFEVQGPWVRPVGTPSLPVYAWITIWAIVIFGLAGFVAIGVLVRRNVRLGRGDRKGALRLAGFLFLSSTLGLLLRADHVALVFDETALVVNLAAQTLMAGVLAWTEYLAFEPIARRRWPELLISWSRLLAGRLGDPLVGRDLLVGGLAGVALALVVHLGVAAPSWFGLPPPAPRAPVITSLSALRHLAHFFFVDPVPAFFVGLGNFFFLFFFRALFRKRWLALGLQFALTYLIFALMTGANQLFSLSAAVFTALWLAILTRAGLLASVVSFYFFLTLNATPLTLDLSAWYAGRTLVSFAALGTVLVYGFHGSLGGKPLFGFAVLEAEGEA